MPAENRRTFGRPDRSLGSATGIWQSKGFGISDLFCCSSAVYQRSVIVCGFLFLKILNRIDPPFDSRSTRIKSPGSPTVDESALRITSAGFNPDSLAGV